MGKGSGRRPTNEAAFASGWDRIFGKTATAGGIAAQLDERVRLMGCSSTVERATLTGLVESSNLSAPATYVDDATGMEVDEDYWPA